MADARFPERPARRFGIAGRQPGSRLPQRPHDQTKMIWFIVRPETLFRPSSLNSDPSIDSMKTSTSQNKSRRIAGLLAGVALILLAAGVTRAADGIWISTADGSWNNPANWAGGVIADGSDSTAYFTNDI